MKPSSMYAGWVVVNVAIGFLLHSWLSFVVALIMSGFSFWMWKQGR